LKLLMNAYLLLTNTQDGPPLFSIKRLGSMFIFNILLSVLYFFNNNLTFIILIGASPTTFLLFKSIAPIIVTIFQTIAGDEKFSQSMILAILLQIAGSIVMQYDGCAHAFLSPKLFAWLALATLITSVSSAINGAILKEKEFGSVQEQSIIMYSSGCIFNFAYFISRKELTTFFHGFDSISACLVVFINAFIGVLVTFLYKHVDVLMKNFATSTSIAAIAIISYFLFDSQYNVLTFIGSIMVSVALYNYSVEKAKVVEELARLKNIDAISATLPSRDTITDLDAEEIIAIDLPYKK